MKILFLDVDGVLNHDKSPGWETHGSFCLDDKCIENLKHIIEATGVQVVLSSTWRWEPERIRVLASKGLSFIGRTPQGKWSGQRQQDILSWLQNVWPYASGVMEEKIEKMAILDDDSDADIGDGSFFKTSFENGGLTQEIVARVVKHLT